MEKLSLQLSMSPEYLLAKPQRKWEVETSTAQAEILVIH